MSARARVAEPNMAMPMNAPCKAREQRDVFILDPQLSLVCRKAACVYPRGFVTTQRATGACAPIRPEFEEDARGADGSGRQAGNHFAAGQSDRTQQTDGIMRPMDGRSIWSCSPP